MSLRQKVRLELDDGREIVVEYDGRDLRAWESKHHLSAIREEMTISMLSWLGHHAAIRTGILNGELTTYEAFDAVCVSVDGVRDSDEPPNPTKPGKGTRKKAGDGSSAP